MSSNVGSWQTRTFPPCVSVLLDQPEIGPEWKSWMTFELALRGIILDMKCDGDEILLQKNEDIIGFYRFLELEQTEAMLQATGAEVHALRCPWGGRIRGALGWSRLGLESELLDSFLPFLSRRCRGPFIHTDERIVHEPLRQVTFPLSNLTRKFGFDDGDALLNREPDYLEYVRREAETALARAGMVAGVGDIETHHNPMRIWGPIRRLDQWEEVPDRELSSVSMTIWAYDDSFLKDVAYW